MHSASSALPCQISKRLAVLLIEANAFGALTVRIYRSFRIKIDGSTRYLVA